MEKIISGYLPENMAEAITHTLLHNLWQGMVLVILVAMILHLTKRTAAIWRYRFLTATLLLFTLVVALTFILELYTVPDRDFNLPDLHPSNSKDIPALLWQNLAFSLKYIHEHAGLISMFWILAVIVQICRLSLGFYVLQRMKMVRIAPVGKFWQQRLQELCSNLGLRHTVNLLESGIAQVPIVIGYLKPLILIPVGLITALNQAQVEAILLHELAHIRRKDGLVNLVQILMETLLFFNPAVWWLSSLIRSERENCCDDIAVQHLSSPVDLMSAMVYFEQYRREQNKLSLAFSGASTRMPARMERLLKGKKNSPGKLDFLVIALLLTIGTLAMVPGPRNQVQFLVKIPLSVGKPSAEANRKAHEDKKRAEADAIRRTRPYAVPHTAVSKREIAP
ncbi:M56 family metallopeptidase [Pedobacter sp.]|jgi:bla regulator protein BlaR1|uniref:M56 family metallopeptidase n=1 Tax=Pedobacter sp. TaxID=1411316 RepID=UPI002B9ACECE|nr:M56 family metallopeptidase [Pedobacter sp.]HWW39635.1 M56 family metallopeptidase [Pedobacter sp.]